MKKLFKSTSLLALIIVGALALTGRSFIPLARATYVEGPITQDTLWTLADSPFVVSKDVIVYPGVTLTIEPGVEVRFGGGFSLVVEGRLYACGEENNTITFTTNKDQPQGGDWNTIKFNGTQPSTLMRCIVQYAIDGLTIENGNVRIEDCEIANNSQSGISITGNNQVTIKNNKISSNKNGILVTGDSIRGVSITENIVMSNTQSGIQLDADKYRDLVILNNILSANKNGFYVSGEASTYITNNSISYNNVGIFYKSGKGHVAYYNDIYGNDCGMDVSSNATVNAEHNYWGHETGPYHVSLNPAGEGDPVGGDGVNLDFIFFLSAPISHINERPTARLLTDRNLVPPNQAVTFVASLSSDDGRVDKYLFDFGDGSSSGWTTLSIFVHKYSSVGTYNARVTVMDDFGVTSTNVAMVTVDVQDLNPLEVSVVPSRFIVDCGEEVSVTVGVTYQTSAVENANITLFAVKGGTFTPSSGLTNSTGYFTTTFTAPNVTQATNIRIIATASKGGYADGSDYVYLTILAPLSVDVIVDPSLIESEATSEVTTYVTYGGEPVVDAFVVVWSDGGGNFSSTSGMTNSNGTCTFVFTAPQVTRKLNVTITATTIKAGYADGKGYARIAIEPKKLVVKLELNPATVSSEEKAHVTAYVTHDMTPISDVNVTMSSMQGTFSPETGVTDSNGTVTFTFTAPQATTQLNFNLTATATKAGYADGEGQAQIIVNPGILYVQVGASPTTIQSGATSTVTVHLTYHAKPVADALVTIWSDSGGEFSTVEAITDSNGDCTFIFTAPKTTTQLNVTITVTATKAGYIDGESQIKITVYPEPVGWLGLPLTTILMIAVVIVVVAIVVLLIKLEVIYISER